ncbi:IclR family transcriptional regulator [Desulfopila sp. IMCC35008]|uniref:IclR family transcriptional regulator n=1 Tax=Desulfopila sp. IMCC35008 TaxID=2653858 RepID=UPI0013D68A29|nr:IclR family transcriptional regulator [Desulfopila sp. IMCC35008]
MSKGKDYFSKSLEKGLRVLSLFDHKTKILTQSEIARRLNLNMTSTYRYINTLVEMGYLVKDEKSKAICPSAQCLVFCNNLLRATGHLKMIKQVVDQVHRQHNISIEVAFADGISLIRVYNREAEETFTYSLPDSTENSFHTTALGKAYLSTFPDDLLRERVHAMELKARTNKTITDRDTLLQEISTAKTKQFATTDEEYLPGLLAIAAPIYDPVSGTGVGAVSFDFSTMEHTGSEIEEKYSGLVKETANRLSEFSSPDMIVK